MSRQSAAATRRQVPSRQALPAAHPSLFRELDYAQYRVDTFRYYSSQIAPIRARETGQPRRYEVGAAFLLEWDHQETQVTEFLRRGGLAAG